MSDHQIGTENRSEVTDGDLLARFLGSRDEEAFTALVARHGGLVLAVCRRALHDVHDVEDAFQAVFLILARDAGKIRKRRSLASWLYGVAFRTAVRASARKQRRREESLGDETVTTHDSFDQLTNRHEQQVLDEELHALPDRYRDPLVLYYLVGKTAAQVAAELQLSASAVEGRLRRARRELRLRMARRGISLGLVLAAFQATQRAAEATTLQSLVTATVSSAMEFTLDPTSIGNISQNVTHLVGKEVTVMISSTSIVKASALVAVVVLLGTFAGFAGRGNRAAAENQNPRTVVIPKGNVQRLNEIIRQPPVLVAQAGDVGVSGNNSARTSTLPATSVYSTTNAAEERIQAALDEPTQMEFIETPLQDVIDFLEDQHEIQIRLDTRALDVVGIGTDSPITSELKGVHLKSALNLILRDLELDYIVRDEVLLVTTKEEADSFLVTKLYSLRTLLGHEPEQVAEVIQRTIRPASWATATPMGDKKTGKGVVEPIADALVITQNQRVHEEIANLFKIFHQHAPRRAPVRAEISRE